MELAIIDNFDSFTYNLIQIIEQSGFCSYKMYTNLDLEKISSGSYDKVLISPGPGLPEEAGQLMQIVDHIAGRVPVLGICLGHEAIARHYGCRLKQLDDIFHGVASPMIHLNRNDILMKDVPENFMGGRYHSWVIDPVSVPEAMEVLAVDEENNIMAISVPHDQMRGLQFHPESFLTPFGTMMLKNWLKS